MIAWSSCTAMTRKYGAISNTVAAATVLEGVIRRSVVQAAA